MTDLKNLPKVTLAWMPENKELRARGARPLEHKHRDGTLEVVLPEEKGGHVIYVVTDIYARLLLSECSRHFKLLEPSKMLIGFNTQVGAREFRTVHSILTRKGFGDATNPESTPANETEPPKDFGLGAQEETGPEAAAKAEAEAAKSKGEKAAKASGAKASPPPPPIGE